ncbi:MAG TPA: aspartate carbamoyltransferase [Solirubrobacteraceae bacterium]|nr:aspartate carbamoyltransferase [Solirubrobacteraceae bacterium]
MLDHLTSIDQVDDELVREIFDTADDMAAALRIPTRLSSLAGRVIALLFFEPSSRTILSFHAAAARLGAAVIEHRGVESSSLSKGESIEDTVRVVGAYADLIVLRHEEPGVAERVAQVSPVPLINGGDGTNEHPTQALIDMYTIHHELGRLHSLRLGMGFDQGHSRSIHSLCRGLCHYPDNDVLFVGPEELWLDEDELDDLRERGLTVAQSTDMQRLLEREVLYLNRFQTERIADPDTAAAYRERYCLTAADLAGSAVQLLLDPLPRIHEIATDVDSLPQAAYFQQAANGVPIRMALLSMLA